MVRGLHIHMQDLGDLSSVIILLASIALLGVGLVAALVWVPVVRSAVCWLGAAVDETIYGTGYETYDIRGLILPSPAIRGSNTEQSNYRSVRVRTAYVFPVIGTAALTASAPRMSLLQMTAGIALLSSAILWSFLRSHPSETTGGIILLHRRNRLSRWLTRRIPVLEAVAYPATLHRLSRDQGFATTAEFLRATLFSVSDATTSRGMVRAWGILIAAPDLVVSEDQLDRWSNQSDDLADAALEEVLRAREVDTTLPQDHLDAIAVLVRRSGYDGCRAFWQDCTSLPPFEVGADSVSGVRHNSHAWTKSEESIIQSGQQMFFRYATGLLTSMLHGSLATGFALPRMVRVLETTGYLLGRPSDLEATSRRSQPSQEDKTWDRLMHTTGWVVDAMQWGADGLLPPRPLPDAQWSQGGAGWRAVVKVRLIHARVRRTVLARATVPNGRGFYPPRDGVPINQTDMAATLGAFCAVPLISLAQLGLSVPQDQADAFVALWRVIGYYSGIDSQIVQRHFATPAASQAFTFSAGRHLASLSPLPPDSSESEGNGSIAVRLLGAVADRPPTKTTLNSHIALVRYLAGPELAAMLGLPRVVPSVQWGSVWLYKVLVVLPPTVGRWYPRRAFENKRLKVARLLIPALLQTQGKASRTRLGQSFAHHDTLGPEKTHAPDWPAIRRLHLQVTLEMVAVVAAVATAPVWLSATALVVGWYCGLGSSL